jgi:hypothetical protein
MTTLTTTLLALGLDPDACFAFVEQQKVVFDREAEWLKRENRVVIQKTNRERLIVYQLHEVLQAERLRVPKHHRPVN